MAVRLSDIRSKTAKKCFFFCVFRPFLSLHAVKGKTLLGDDNKLFAFKILLTMPSNVLALRISKSPAQNLNFHGK